MRMCQREGLKEKGHLASAGVCWAGEEFGDELALLGGCRSWVEQHIYWLMALGLELFETPEFFDVSEFLFDDTLTFIKPIFGSPKAKRIWASLEEEAEREQNGWDVLSDAQVEKYIEKLRTDSRYRLDKTCRINPPDPVAPKVIEHPNEKLAGCDSLKRKIPGDRDEGPNKRPKC